MKNIAIIGASYLQLPLIKRAQEMGLTTHVFAWAADDVGEREADFFYPISIIEKEEILEKCKEIEIDGICSIASDLAAITVNFVANKMGLIGNSEECVAMSTDKHKMRICFEKNGVPSPKSILVKSVDDLENVSLRYPVIVKPTDRSGSRGITKLQSEEGLKEAIESAKEQGFKKVALVEEFVEGQEYSVECISWKGEHHFLAMTKKYTTGAPHFIETGHIEPAPVSDDLQKRVTKEVFHALDSLKIQNGASHSELKISNDGEIKFIEIGGRMGGDCIGSSLVPMSTGVDYVKAVIQIAIGQEPILTLKKMQGIAAVKFIFSEKDLCVLKEIEENNPDMIIEKNVNEVSNEIVMDSSARFGYFILCSNSFDKIEKYLTR